MIVWHLQLKITLGILQLYDIGNSGLVGYPLSSYFFQNYCFPGFFFLLEICVSDYFPSDLLSCSFL